MSSICGSVDALYTDSRLLRVLFALETGIALLAILCLLLLLFLLVAWRMFSSHVRIVVSGFCLALLISNLSVIISSIYHLHAIIIRPKDTRCYWLSFNYGDCYLLKNLGNIGAFLIYAGTAAFSLERIINAITSPPKRIRNIIAGVIVCLQFISPIIVILRSIPSSALTTSHCARIFPNLVEMKHFFFVIVGIQVFSLAAYSALLFHVLTMKPRMTRANFELFSSANDTLTTFPIVMVSIAFFLVNLLLDHDFLFVLKTYLTGLPKEETNKTIATVAFWNELQALNLPVFSLIFFGMIVRYAWNSDSQVYEKTLSECAQSLKTFYETMSPQTPRTCRRTKSSEDVHRCENPDDLRSKTLPNVGKSSLNSPKLGSKVSV